MVQINDALDEMNFNATETIFLVQRSGHTGNERTGRYLQLGGVVMM